jgi:hypothetical protein
MTLRLTFLAAVILFVSTGVVKGQLAATQSSSILNQFVTVNKPIKIFVGRVDRSYANNIYVAPMSLNVLSLPGDPSWTGSISSQSFHNGKFGRFYCWDAQGNLRSSYLFLDISGKKKRGFKLALAKHRMMVDNRNKIVF